jgi:hypothetical protein
VETLGTDLFVKAIGEVLKKGSIIVESPEILGWQVEMPRWKCGYYQLFICWKICILSAIEPEAVLKEIPVEKMTDTFLACTIQLVERTRQFDSVYGDDNIIGDILNSG